MTKERMDKKLSLDFFKNINIMVVGDLMLDTYVFGDINKISPEAPVPVFNINNNSTKVLGGAGNVVSNLYELGCNVTVLGICGKDTSGKKLLDLLNKKKVNASVKVDEKRPTINKTRLISKGQQIIRIDKEKISPLPNYIKNSLLTSFELRIRNSQALILSDYGKGVFEDEKLTKEFIKQALIKNIPVFIDPKGNNWQKYRNATCVTPNLKELEAIYGKSIKTEEELHKAMYSIINIYNFSYLLVTRGSKGMTLLKKDCIPCYFPTSAKEVYDVSGAGDTVISVLASCVAKGLPFDEAIILANTSAGRVIEKLGTHPISIYDLVSLVKIDDSYKSKVITKSYTDLYIQSWKTLNKKIVFTNGCFDLIHSGHIYFLTKAKKLGDKLIVGLNSDSSVKRLKGDTRPILNENDRALILSSLSCVDGVIIFDENTPQNLIRTITPDILVKGSDYQIKEVVGRDIVNSYGGEVKLINTLDGYSTTNIIQKILEVN